MSSLTNLFRDQLHVTPSQDQPDWSSVRSAGLFRNCLMNSTGIVNQTSGMVWSSAADTSQIGPAQVKGAGLLISQPIVDATPYRIKGRLTGGDLAAWLFVGYAPAAPTGTDDLIESLVNWPLVNGDSREIGIFDEIILMPGLKEGDDYYQRPLAIGFMISDTPNNVGCGYNISVQNLSRTAPQFASSMS